VNKLFSLILRM